MVILKKVTRKSQNKRLNHITHVLANSPWIQSGVIFLMIILLTYKCYCVFSESCDDSGKILKLAKDFKQVCYQLRKLRQKHDRLTARIKENVGRFPAAFFQNISLHTEALAPTTEYEKLRRSIYANTKELWYCVQAQMERVDNRTNRPVRRKIGKDLVDNVAERKRWLLVQQEQLASSDGYSEWRRQEALDVATVVQRRLWYLQHPPNCRSGNKLVCTHNQGGFGCKHHHLMFCLMYAYATKRTLILSETETVRANYKGWSDVFYHLSESCKTAFSDKQLKWAGPATSDARVLYMPVMDLKKVLKMKPLLLPYFIPKFLAKRISRFNSDPEAWWAGQMLRYILRPRPYVKSAIYRAMEQMNLTSLNLVEAEDTSRQPMVGIHVRWTDKDREVPLYSIKSYMTHVEDYYLKLEMTQNVPERRVYVATDDVRVLQQANASYPNYKFFGSANRANLASVDVTRYTEEALIDLMVDLHILTLCDYVVGTFSSNFGKMAYELMHITLDATHRFHSLDDSYFMSSSTLEPHYRRAVQRSCKHPTFEIGDIIKHYYFRPGSIGKVERTQDHGPIPWYKTDRHLSTYTAPRIDRVQVYIDDVSNTTEDNFFNFSFDIPRKLLSPQQSTNAFIT